MTVEAAPLADPIREQSGDQSRFEFTRLIRASGYVAVVLSLAAAGSTFFILMGLTPIAPTPDVVFTAMLVNGGLVSYLLFVVAW